MFKPIILRFICFVLIFTALFSACKKADEHIERDILVANIFNFAIPVLTSTEDTVVPILKLNSEILLDSVIKKQAPDFGAGNLTRAEILSFQVVLIDTPIDNSNNLQNFEILNATIQANEVGDLTVANATSISDSKTAALTLPLINGNTNILPYLQKGTFNYEIKGRARTATTKSLNARATAVYKLRVAM